MTGHVCDRCQMPKVAMLMVQRSATAGFLVCRECATPEDVMEASSAYAEGMSEPAAPEVDR